MAYAFGCCCCWCCTYLKSHKDDYLPCDYIFLCLQADIKRTTHDNSQQKMITAFINRIKKEKHIASYVREICFACPLLACQINYNNITPMPFISLQTCLRAILKPELLQSYICMYCVQFCFVFSRRSRVCDCAAFGRRRERERGSFERISAACKLTEVTICVINYTMSIDDYENELKRDFCKIIKIINLSLIFAILRILKLLNAWRITINLHNF